MGNWGILALLIILVIWTALGLTVARDWNIEQSPTTGICYEVRTVPVMLGATRSMSQIDDSWCEEKANGN